MIDLKLQTEINIVMSDARGASLEFVTVEHMLLALINIEDVNTFLLWERVDIDNIRKQLKTFIKEHVPVLDKSSNTEIVPTVGFQRVLQRSVYQAQTRNKSVVYGLDVLLSLLSETDSFACEVLRKNEITSNVVLRKVNHSYNQPIPIDKDKPIINKVTYNKDGKVCNNSKPYTGQLVKRHDNDEVAVFGLYKDGEKNGNWIEYYDNGKYKFLVKYAKGKKEGTAIYWNEKGVKTKEESYKHGLLDGPTIVFTWYKNGKTVENKI